MLRTASITIGDHAYSIQTLAASDGFEVLGMLGSFLGGPLGALIAAKGKSDDEAEFDLSALGPALSDLGQHLASPDFRAVVYRLLDGARGPHPVNGQEVVLINGKDRKAFDVVFSGNYDELARLVGFALTENFGGFFKNLNAAGGAKLKAVLAANRPKPRPASTGA